MHSSTWQGAWSPGRQRWLAAGLVLLLLALVTIQYAAKARADRSAILRWRSQILQLDEIDIYRAYTYPNPPIMPLLLRPFAELPPLAASLTWFSAKLLLTVLAFVWVFRLVETPALRYPLWAKGLTVLLSLRPIIGDLTHGNVNLFILFLVIGCLYAFHQGRDVTAGVSLGLAIACKVTPALFIPYFLWKRSWRTLAGCALGLVLFLVVVPGAFLGMERNLQLLTSWYDGMVKPFVAGGEVTTDHINQSLPGLVFRLGAHRPSFYEKGVPTEYSNLVDWDPRLLTGIVKGCMGAFALVVLWTCRTPERPRAGWRLAAEYSLVILGMLLFSERTWKHHCVTLVLPFAVIVYYLAVCQPGPALRNFLVGTLAAATLLMSVTMSGFAEPLTRVAKLAEAGGAYVWSFLILTIALAVLLRQQPRKAALHF